MPSSIYEYKLDLDDSLGDQALLSPLKKQISSSRYHDPGLNEWWYIFLLQFLLWWSLSSIFDSIPTLLAIPSAEWTSLLYFYLSETALGGTVYALTIPRTNEKLRKFIGIVILCCGVWGCLTIMTNGIQSAFGVHPIFVYGSTVILTGSLGFFHHNMYCQDYLLDQLL